MIRRKALGSMLAWLIYLPAYGLFAVAGTLGVALLGAFGVGVAQGSAWVLVNMGLISLVHRGAHATGLLFIAPLFALSEPRAVFSAAGVVIAATGLIGLAAARGRAAAARAPA